MNGGIGHNENNSDFVEWKIVSAHYINCMSKENKDKDMLVRVQPSLFKQFREKCEKNYKSISEVIRDFMIEYIKDKKWSWPSR